MLTTSFSAGLANMTFSKNNYFSVGDPAAETGYNASGGNGGGAAGGESFRAWQTAGKDAGSVVADPQFTNLSTFTLSASAPSLTQLGFKPIDISKVGPSGMGGVPPGANADGQTRAAVSGAAAALAEGLLRSGLLTL
jgi:hypothetical protein